MFFNESKDITSNEYKSKLIEKYKDKSKLPKTKNDRLAYIYCNYTRSDIAKFCNEKDTKKLKSLLTKYAKYFSDKGMPMDDSDIEFQCLKAIEKDNKCCVHVVTIYLNNHPIDIYYNDNINKTFLVGFDSDKPDVSISTISLERTLKQDLGNEYNIKL